MFHLTLSPELTSRCPEYRGAAVLANVTNTPYSDLIPKDSGRR